MDHQFSWLEREAHNPEVAGSRPAWSTKTAEWLQSKVGSPYTRVGGSCGIKIDSPGHSRGCWDGNFSKEMVIMGKIEEGKVDIDHIFLIEEIWGDIHTV